MPDATAYAALIRHGAYHQQPGAPSARQPHPLTDEGVDQARACGDGLAQVIRKHGLDLDPVLWSSQQLRAWQTADVAAARLRSHGFEIDEIRETPDLAERGLGSAANLTVAQIEAILAADPRHDPPPQGWKSDSAYRLPLDGAESLMDAGARVANHLRSLIEPAPRAGRLTVFVGHGASFRHAAHHLGLLQAADIARLSMFHAQPLLICYNVRDSWRHFAGAWKVRPRAEDPVD